MDFICEFRKNVTGNIWIGGNMGAFEYEWKDGSKFDYTNWNNGETNFDAKYLAIEIDAGNCRWNDVNKFNDNYYICKKSI